MAMHELIYASAARTHLDPLQLGAILEVSRRNNARVGVTGILLYHEGSFFQVLEGEHETLMELYHRISLDPRHTRVSELRSQPIKQPSFGAWSMGFVALDPRLLRELPGRHALSSNGTFDGEEASAVLALIEQFRRGQHRKYLLG